MGSRTHKVALNFNTMAQVDVPQGRNGKHKEIVLRVLSDLEKVPAGTALKIPLAELTESKEKVRSALNRAIHKTRRDVATASDEEYLYVWNKAR